MSWECELLRELAGKLQSNPELASKIRVIALNFEDLRRENAEKGARIEDQIELIWDLRRSIKNLRNGDSS